MGTPRHVQGSAVFGKSVPLRGESEMTNLQPGPAEDWTGPGCSFSISLSVRKSGISQKGDLFFLIHGKWDV